MALTAVDGLAPRVAHGQARGAAPIPDQYIVVLRPGANPHAQAQAAAGQGAQVLHVYEHALRGFAFRGSAQAAQALTRNPNVLYVNQDQEVRAFEDVTPTGVARIGANAPRSEIKLGNVGSINVAVIDTGIGPHADLNIRGGKNCSQGQSYADGYGHGTHVAGTIGAKANGTGVVGVAPGVGLWAVRVLNNAGSGSWASVICGIDWATGTWTDGDSGNDISVANMSLGGAGADDPATCAGTPTQALKAAICNSRARGIVYVVAAGNDNQDARNFVPAAYADAVLTVSAVADSDGRPGHDGSATSAGPDDTLASFSNWGLAVDIAAPGVDILSTCKGGGTCRMSGTSMAAPHVAGVAALYVATEGKADSAGEVDAISSAIVTPGNGYSVAQTDLWGFTDRDGGGLANREPLAYVGSGVIVPPPPTAETYTLTVVRSGKGRGTVTTSDGSIGINCGFDCSDAYQATTAVKLTAEPARGSTFTGWEGCDTPPPAPNNPLTCTVTMTGNKTVTAVFSR